MDDIPKRLEFLITAHANGRATVFAKKAGIPTSTFQYYVNGRMPHGEHLKHICETFNVNLNWLLTGKGDPYIKEDKPNAGGSQAPPPSNVIEIEHMELVRGFQDKPRALSINKGLMELEKLDQETFKRIETYIKATVDQVKYAAEQAPMYSADRRRGERRTQEAPSSKGEERRSGKNRRSASAIKKEKILWA